MLRKRGTCHGWLVQPCVFRPEEDTVGQANRGTVDGYHGGQRRMLSTTTNQSAPQINVNDPALAATLEVLYLRPLLESLPEKWRNAIDVGAHRGDVTEALATLGYRVLALEPQHQ